MFNRVSSLAQVYPSLRSRFTPSDQVWKHPKLSLTIATARRWQSAFGTRIENDDVTSDVIQPTETREPDDLIRPRRRDASNTVRHWRPHKTAELGIDVLGRPAEVLILPSRDRKIYRAPIAGDEIETVGIQQSLDSELQPISWEEIKRNIEAIRTDIGEDTDEFTPSNWRKAKKSLASGFTQEQLQKYMIESGQLGDENTKGRYHSDTKSKMQLASWILQNAWGFKSQPEAASFQIGDTETATFSKTLQVSPASLELALLDKKQPLKEMSERYQVRLDVFREGSKIALHGQHEGVIKAQKQIQRLLRVPVTRSLALDGRLQQLLREENAEEDFLNMLRQKHAVIVERRLDELIITSTTEEQINLVHRDLILANEVDGRDAGFQLLQITDPPGLVTVPVYPPASQRWFSDRLSWERQVSGSMESSTSKTSTSFKDFKALSQTIASRLADGEKYITGYYAYGKQYPETCSESYTIDIGQVLALGGQNVSSRLPEVTTQRRRESSFVSEIPLLPQALANMASASQKIDQELDSDPPTLIRFRLQPLNKSNTLPRFELILTGKDSTQGLQQPLEVRRVSALVREKDYDLLLPCCAVDLRISKTIKYELFGDQVKADSSETRLRLLQGLARCLDRLQSGEGVGYDPFLTLDLSSLIGGQVSLIQSSSNADSKTDTKSSSSHQGIDDAQARLPRSNLESVQYLLEPPEILDARLYKTSQNPNIFLEHVFADAGSQDMPRHQELLRVVHDPVSHLLSTSNATVRSKPTRKSFDEMLRAAFDIAGVLGDRGKLVAKTNV